jgi:uncharacterized protein (TIGR02231 family)
MQHTIVPAVVLGFLSSSIHAHEGIAVPSSVGEVTVYSGSARVERRASYPAGGGRLLLVGLPFGMDSDSVGVRCRGGVGGGVVGRVRGARGGRGGRGAAGGGGGGARARALQVLLDDEAILKGLLAHVESLLREEAQAHARETQAGRANAQAWEENYAFVQRKLGELKTALRELGWRMEDARLALQEAQTELGRCQGGAGVRLRDVVLDVVDTGGQGGTLSLEYAVGDAGWAPLYDLRAHEDLSAVELVYRAKIWQRTGEDWRDAAIVLSTARPERGAQGPEPAARWLSVFEEVRLRTLGHASEDAARGTFRYDRAAGETLAEPAPFAQASDEGLSARFHLPRPESIESREAPTSVLVGRATLAIRAEHTCFPEADPTVWLRARAANTSAWVMLPGRAAVYFGADFVGHADLGAVEVGQELVLHLGADPGLSVVRREIEDEIDGPGVFGSRESHRRRWTIEIENHGAQSAAADGSVTVVVQEVLPKSRDERIEVALEEASPALAKGELWSKLREEQGILTWVLTVPKGAKRAIELETEISYPEDVQVVMN